jgi:hypothetical protein
MQGQMDRQNGRRLQSHWWVFLVADSCRLIVGGAGGAIPGFADQHPEIGESDQRAGIVGTVTVTEAAVLAGPPNGEPGPTCSNDDLDENEKSASWKAFGLSRLL